MPTMGVAAPIAGASIGAGGEIAGKGAAEAKSRMAETAAKTITRIVTLYRSPDAEAGANPQAASYERERNRTAIQLPGLGGRAR